MEQRDEQLWKLAKKRANTKRNGLVYLTIIVFLWIIWLSNNDFTFGKNMIYACLNGLLWGLVSHLFLNISTHIIEITIL